jgi:hypothetical protein
MVEHRVSTPKVRVLQESIFLLAGWYSCFSTVCCSSIFQFAVRIRCVAVCVSFCSGIEGIDWYVKIYLHAHRDINLCWKLYRYLSGWMLYLLVRETRRMSRDGIRAEEEFHLRDAGPKK